MTVMISPTIRSVHPNYGSLDDFKAFLKAAHDRGIRVIIELVLNHTSDQHVWFQGGAKFPRQSQTRLVRLERHRRPLQRGPHHFPRYGNVELGLGSDLEVLLLAPLFQSHQPDLNYDNPAVFEAMWGVMKFWLDIGVDGFRLDAVPYLVERDGTSCENLPETHAIIRELRRRLDAEYPDKMLLAEANQWPADVSFLFWRRRRIPHGVSFSAHATHFHGRAA